MSNADDMVARLRTSPPQYFDAEESAQDLVDEAWQDSDAVSLTWLLQRTTEAAPDEMDTRLPDEPVDGAVVVIKGDANVRAFETWATERGLLTVGKPIVDADVQPGRN